MLVKGALALVDHPGPGLYSRLFLVQKATEGWRPVINLLSLNGYVTLAKFQMETVASVLGLIQKGEVMFLTDPKDGYFQIPIHLDSLQYFRIVITGKVNQFRALCFSLSSTPQVFTRVFFLVSELARQQGISLFRYLHDWLVVAESLPLLLHYSDLLLQLF